MRESPIFIIDTDAAKLRGILAARASEREGRDQAHLDDLATELERAIVVDAEAVPNGVVMVNSGVEVVDLTSGVRREFTLVFPVEADPVAGKVSVLAPLGCALMGCREGDVVEWEMPGGLQRLRIDRVSSPESAPAAGMRHAKRVPGRATAHGEGIA